MLFQHKLLLFKVCCSKSKEKCIASKRLSRWSPCFLSCKKGVKEESFFSFMICTYYIIFYLFASFMFHKKCQKDVLYLIFKASSMIYFTVDSIRNWSLNLILKMNWIHRNPIFKIHWGQYLGKGHAIFGIRSKAKLSGQHGWIVKWSDFFIWLRETS